MKTENRTRLKVCCIASIDEARLAISHGADAIGLVGRMPSGPGPIDDNLIAEIARHIPPPTATFLLTCETEAEAIIAHVRRARVNTVQLVDRVEPSVYSVIRQALPTVQIVQVIHVEGATALDESRRCEAHVDALLLDSGRPSAAIRELGGTGRTHDWLISHRIVESVARPVFLAGGIRPGNVAEAIKRVRPYGIDLCSGVRTGGRLDSGKLADLVDAMRSADRGGVEHAADDLQSCRYDNRTRRDGS